MPRTSGAYQKKSRCWPGYEPVPGKRPNQQGSCRKVPASRNDGVEVERETARKKAQQAAKTPGQRARIKMKSSSAATRAEGKRELARAEGKSAGGASRARAPRSRDRSKRTTQARKRTS